MNKKTVTLVVIFVLFVGVLGLQARKASKCCSPVVNRSTATAEAKTAMESNEAPAMSVPSQVIVYYFHGNFRCTSCTQIERYTKDAVEAGFADQIKSGLLVFRPVNVEKPGNDHFVQDYQLYTKSVVLSLVKGGKEVRFKNLDKVWEYLRDRKRFDDYVRNGVKEYLEAVQ